MLTDQFLCIAWRCGCFTQITYSPPKIYGRSSHCAHLKTNYQATNSLNLRQPNGRLAVSPGHLFPTMTIRSKEREPNYRHSHRFYNKCKEDGCVCVCLCVMPDWKHGIWIQDCIVTPNLTAETHGYNIIFPYPYTLLNSTSWGLHSRFWGDNRCLDTPYNDNKSDMHIPISIALPNQFVIQWVSVLWIMKNK